MRFTSTSVQYRRAIVRAQLQRLSFASLCASTWRGTKLGGVVCRLCLVDV